MFVCLPAPTWHPKSCDCVQSGCHVAMTSKTGTCQRAGLVIKHVYMGVFNEIQGGALTSLWPVSSPAGLHTT